MDIADLVRYGFLDPLGFFVLSYLLGAAMCGAWALAIEPLRRVRRGISVRIWVTSWRGRLRTWKPRTLRAAHWGF